MALTEKEKESFIRFLCNLEKQILAALDTDAAVQFFSTIVDFSAGDDEFNVRIANVFKDRPERLKDENVLNTIKSLSTIRNAMKQKYANSQETRTLTVKHFIQRINDLENEEDDKDGIPAREKLETAHDELIRSYSPDRRKLTSKLEKLRRERQMLHDLEIEKQKERREEKLSKQKELQEVLQEEFEKGVQERKERRERIEREIEDLKVKLQEDHERQLEERKEVKKKRVAEMRERQQRQYAEQERQAMKRKRKKMKEKMMMQARQQALLEQQMKQKRDRMAKKKRQEMQLKIDQRRLREQIESKSKENVIHPTSSNKLNGDVGNNNMLNDITE